MRFASVLGTIAIASFLVGCDGASSSGSAAYDVEYERQVEVFNQQAETYERQSKKIDEHSEQFARILEKQESNESRFEKLLSRWEEQSKRAEAILDAQEKSAGIAPQAESPGAPP